MAPTNSACFDYRSQIVDNCRFFSAKNAEISLITAKDPLGGFKALVVRSEGRKRDPLLSVTAATFQEAIQDLHTKSTEAVQNYISTNGFAPVRELKKRSTKDDDDDSDSSDGSASSTIALSHITCTTCESLSDDETVSVASGEKTKGKKSKKRGRKTSGKEYKANNNHRGRSRSRSSSRSPSRSRSRSRSLSPTIIDLARPPPMKVHPGVLRPIGVPPPPPSGWAPGVRPPPPPAMRFPAAPGLPPPPPAPVVSPASAAVGRQLQPLLRDVRLHIKWIGHGEQRVIDRSRASLKAIQDIAVNYVRRNMFAYQNVTPVDAHPSKLWGLRATVKQAYIDNERYDMSSYGGDDLSKLIDVTSVTDIPRFEIEVDNLPPGVHRVSPPPQRN